MARLHHVAAATVLAQWPADGPSTGGPTWKPSHPTPVGAVEPWFALTPRVPWVDNRLGTKSDAGVAATLETFGGVTGPSALVPGSESAPAVLGGQAVPPGTPSPPTVGEFSRYSHARIALDAEGIPTGHQCLLLVAVRALPPREVAAVQLFVGTDHIADDPITGEDRLALVVDVPDGGRLALDIRLRLVGGPTERLAILGVAGHLL